MLLVFSTVISPPLSLGRFGTRSQAGELPALGERCPVPGVLAGQGELLLAFFHSLGCCQKARPGLTFCSGQCEGRSAPDSTGCPCCALGWL